MDTDATQPRWNPHRWRDLLLDVMVPAVFALLTAAFFAVAAQ